MSNEHCIVPITGITFYDSQSANSFYASEIMCYKFYESVLQVFFETNFSNLFIFQ